MFTACEVAGLPPSVQVESMHSEKLDGERIYRVIDNGAGP
jgi:hypothetical protein